MGEFLRALSENQGRTDFIKHGVSVCTLYTSDSIHCASWWQLQESETARQSMWNQGEEEEEKAALTSMMEPFDPSQDE